MASSDHHAPEHAPFDFTTSSSEHHSWNPALRPDSLDHESSPQPTAHPSELHIGSTAHDTAHSDQLDVRTETLDEDAALFSPEETIEEQRRDLEEYMPETQAIAVQESDGVHISQVDVQKDLEDEEALAEHPEEHYEHQADIMDLPNAQAEAPSVPLMDDEEPLPTSGTASHAPTFNSFDNAISGEQESATPANALISRSFTTDFVEPTAAPAEMQSGFSDDQWPPAGDDKTFAELLDDEPAPVQSQSKEPLHKHNASAFSQDWSVEGDASFEQMLGTNAGITLDTQASREAEQIASPDEGLLPPDDRTDEELAAAFQAAFDDDELMDTPNDDIDPSTFFDDDDGLLADDDFLAETPTAAVPEQPQQPQQQQQNKYVPATPQVQSAQRSNPYAPASSTPLGRAGSTPDTGLFDVYNQSVIPSQTLQVQQPARPGVSHAQSFADKAKGGYQSPYDLPMEVVKTRRRPAPQAPAAAPVPPPRVSSFEPQQTADTPPMAPPSGPPRQSSAPTSIPPGSQVGQPAQSPNPPGQAATAPPQKPAPTTGGGFFADLPIAAKPRARPATPTMQPPQLPPQPQRSIPTQVPPAQTNLAPQNHMPPATPYQSGGGAAGLGLRQPERMPLLPDQPSVPLPPPTAPPASAARYTPVSQAAPAQSASRYSPAPNGQNAQAKNRYSTGPPPNGAPAAHAFAPRTSSPLAYQKDKPQLAPQQIAPELTRSVTTSPPVLPAPAEYAKPSPEPKGTNASRYAPVAGGQTSPQRPEPIPRPMSYSNVPAANLPAQGRSMSITGIPQAPHKSGPALPHRRTRSREATFAPPQDDRAHDPLERWKGHPVFDWNDSGRVTYSFPTHAPVYMGGGGQHLRPNPGAIHVQPAEMFFSLDDGIAKFPGPLQARSRGRKKEVIAWLAAKIADLEAYNEKTKEDFSILPEVKKRSEEKVILWKVVKIFAEQDAMLENKPQIEQEIRSMLLPNIAMMGAASDLQASSSAALTADAVDRVTVLQLRQALLEGDRDKAVWLAEEKKMWGHAMLIASTMGPEIWKQIVQSFVRSQVKTVGSDTRGLAFLYQVFGGNSEECIDELIPASARAGFQMMSKDQNASRNPLEGLDQWRETLGLIVGNRTPNDSLSLIALGKLLADYGRVEAAHTCYLFARTLVKHSGPDDPDAHFVLLGSQPKDDNFGHDLDSIMLTEVYEWASSLSPLAAAGSYAPHFQSFKLIHAQTLASHGLRTKAQAYCDHITAAFTSTTKPSPYYHPTFTGSVAELSAFLQQTHSGKGGLFSKPAMNKVSSGAASWFTKFVSGDDESDAASSAPGSEPSGPFGGVQETPPVSRVGSSTNLYNPMLASMAAAAAPVSQEAGPHTAGPGPAPLASPYAPSTAGNRYAPSGYNPQASTMAASETSPSASRYTPNRATPLSMQTSSSAYSAALTPDGSASSPQSGFQPSQAPGYAPIPSAGGAASRYTPTQTVADNPVPAQSSPSFQPYQAETPSYSPRYTPQHSAQYSQGQGTGSFAAPSTTAPANFEAIQQPDPEEGAHSFLQQPEQHSGPYASASNNYSPQKKSYAPSTNSYAPTANFTPAAHSPATSTYDPAGAGYQAPSDGYAPPSAGYAPLSDGYGPPSNDDGGGYQPYQPDNTTQPESPQVKKKSMLDDDDDDELFKRAEALKKSQKAQADRDADDAFRKAAEADAARDKGGDKKAGWLGGWFGGKKEPKDATPGPVRAKLGEESSFYYDEQLKKWVNKKGGSGSSTPAAATPPPPKGPPSRVVSAAMSGPPSGPPSRVSSAGSMPPMRASLGGAGPTSQPLIPGSGPPSRAGTPAAPTSNGAAAAPAAPPSRPSTGLSNATDLDDILGGPPGAKKAGGTLRGKKKGGRYVDVMAK